MAVGRDGSKTLGAAEVGGTFTVFPAATWDSSLLAIGLALAVALDERLKPNPGAASHAPWLWPRVRGRVYPGLAAPLLLAEAEDKAVLIRYRRDEDVAPVLVIVWCRRTLAGVPGESGKSSIPSSCS